MRRGLRPLQWRIKRSRGLQSWQTASMITAAMTTELLTITPFATTEPVIRHDTVTTPTMTQFVTPLTKTTAIVVPRTSTVLSKTTESRKQRLQRLRKELQGRLRFYYGSTTPVPTTSMKIKSTVKKSAKTTTTIKAIKLSTTPAGQRISRLWRWKGGHQRQYSGW